MAIAVFTSFGQLCDSNGDPLSGGTVTVQDAGTTTSRSCFTDTGLSIAATNPIPLDSAGRHEQGMVYISAAAYKVIVKNSSGTTIFTRDNIDPGVPIGSGTLAIANGGTGASDAATARVNLGVATTAQITTLSEEVAELAGAIGSTGSTQIATGTTAQRPTDDLAEGLIRRNTTTGKVEVYDGDSWDPLISEEDITAQISAGMVVQSTYAEYTTNTALSSTIAYDDTVPQIGEGTQIISLAITPKSATNKLRFRFQCGFSCNTSSQVTAALFKDSDASAICASGRINENQTEHTLTFEYEQTTGSTSAQTYTVRVGSNAGETFRLNGTSAARRLGGAQRATLLIEEIKV